MTHPQTSQSYQRRPLCSGRTMESATEILCGIAMALSINNAPSFIALLCTFDGLFVCCSHLVGRCSMSLSKKRSLTDISATSVHGSLPSHLSVRTHHPDIPTFSISLTTSRENQDGNNHTIRTVENYVLCYLPHTQ